MPLKQAHRIASWRYTYSLKVLAFAMALLLSLIIALLLSEKQAWAVELPHNQQQPKQFIAGESSEIMMGTPSVQRTSRALPEVQTPLQEKTMPSSFNAPELVPQPPLSQGDQRGSWPLTSRPGLTPYPESVPQAEPSSNYYQYYYEKDRSPSAESFYLASGNAPSDIRLVQTSSPAYSYQEDRVPKADPTYTPSRDTNWQPKSVPIMNDKGAQASPSNTSTATVSGVSWVRKQTTNRLPALFLQKIELSNLIEEKKFVQNEPLSAAARAKALPTMPAIATRTPALLASAFLSPAKEVPLHPLLDKTTMPNRVVHSTVQPSLHNGASYDLGLLEGQRNAHSSGGLGEPIEGTTQPSSPSAPPAGNSNSFSLSGGGQSGSGSGVSPLLLLGVLLLGSSILRSEGKLRRVFCVFPKPSSALLDPLECPG